MLPTFSELRHARGKRAIEGDLIGHSREDRAIVGYRFGSGTTRISLLAGCHADEPVGPRLLRNIVAYLSQAEPGSRVLTSYEWWIIPDINPDGAERNRIWFDGCEDVFDLEAYLRHVVRELPGDDIEFGFPKSPEDSDARPENIAAARWWASTEKPFDLHVSLHGMAFAGGPWYLLEQAWRDRCDTLMADCRSNVAELGYALHDMQRNGDKGFERIARGFCTRPNSSAMRRYFLDQQDPKTAALFRPSSMETMRSLGGDPLTLVSEMPLFVVPNMGSLIDPTDPVADSWKAALTSYRAAPNDGTPDIAKLQASFSVTPMPINDQMQLQWAFIRAGIDALNG